MSAIRRFRSDRGIATDQRAFELHRAGNKHVVEGGTRKRKRRPRKEAHPRPEEDDEDADADDDSQSVQSSHTQARTSQLPIVDNNQVPRVRPVESTTLPLLPGLSPTLSSSQPLLNNGIVPEMDLLLESSLLDHEHILPLLPSDKASSSPSCISDVRAILSDDLLFFFWFTANESVERLRRGQSAEFLQDLRRRIGESKIKDVREVRQEAIQKLNLKKRLCCDQLIISTYEHLVSQNAGKRLVTVAQPLSSVNESRGRWSRSFKQVEGISSPRLTTLSSL